MTTLEWTPDGSNGAESASAPFRQYQVMKQGLVWIGRWQDMPVADHGMTSTFDTKEDAKTWCQIQEDRR